MQWDPDQLLPSPVEKEHECRNFERIEEWAKDRWVDTGAPGLLVHPILGESFQDFGNGLPSSSKDKSLTHMRFRSSLSEQGLTEDVYKIGTGCAA